MPALTAGEKTLLRAEGHKVTLYLSVFKPDTLLSARINNASIARGDRSIAYDTGTGTGYSLIEAGQTLWVGTSAGDNDTGKVRIKSVTGDQTSGTFTVAENAVDWTDNAYLTEKHNYELWPVFPRIDTNGVFYKDYDVTYTDENEQPPPVVIAGPHQATFVNAANLATFNIDLTGSYAMTSGASISTYAISFTPTANVTWTFSTANGTGTVTFTAADTVIMKATAYDSNAKSQSTYRVLFAHHPTPGNANYPYTEFDFETPPTGDWERGGWVTRLKVSGNATASDFPDGTLICLWQKAIYGSTTQHIGGWTQGSADARQMLFCGYVRGETVRQDWDTGTVSFEAMTVEALLRKLPMFSISLQAKSNPTKWYEYDATQLTAGRAVHHLWRYHSTLFSVADVLALTDNTLKLKASDDFVRGNLYGQADTFARQHGIFAHVVCNKIGQVYVEEDVQMLDDADRAAKATVTDVTTSDRRETITLARRPEKRVGMVHLGGFSFDGATATAIVAKAPGDVPEDEGTEVIHVERQILSSQSQANTLAGRVLAAENNTFPEIRIPFAGHYLGVLDIVPQEWYTLTLAAGDTPRGITWTNQKLVCRNVTCNVDGAGGTLVADGVFEKESTGPDGVTGDYPTTPGTDPTPPGPTWPPPVDPPTSWSSGIAYASHSTGGMFKTTDSAANWSAINSGLSGDGLKVNSLAIYPYVDGVNALSEMFVATDGGIYYNASSGTGTWVDVTPGSNPPNSWADSPAPTVANLNWVWVGCNIHRENHVYALATWQNGASAWRSWLAVSTDKGATWSYHQIATGALANEVLYTSQATPYNVLVFGDSIAGLTTDPDYGYRITWPTIGEFLFTPATTLASVTIDFEYRSNHPSSWTVGTASIRRVSDGATMVSIDSDLRGTSNAWTSKSYTKTVALVSGTQYYLACAPAGGNNWDIRKIDVEANTIQRPDLRAYSIAGGHGASEALIYISFHNSNRSASWFFNVDAFTSTVEFAFESAAGEVYVKSSYAETDKIYLHGNIGTTGIWRYQASAWTDIGDTAAWGSNPVLAMEEATWTADDVFAIVNTQNDASASTDDGTTWVKQSDTPFDVQCLSRHPYNPAEMLIGAVTCAAGPIAVEYTDDTGATWTNKSTGLPTSGKVTAVVMDWT